MIAELVLALSGLEVDRVQQHARRTVLTVDDLADLDLARLRLGPDPEDVGVVAVLDLSGNSGIGRSSQPPPLRA